MKPNKAMRELMTDNAELAGMFAKLPGPVQEVLNIWAELEPTERLQATFKLREIYEAQKALA